MRLRLTLHCNVHNAQLPYNYNYHLSSAIYNLLKFSSPEFSSFLHNCGYKTNGKTYKLFTFTLKPKQYTPGPTSLHLTSPEVDLYISSPLVDNFIKSVVISTFEKTTLDLSFAGSELSFKIRFAELIPPLHFNEQMNFFLSSPMVLSTKKEIEGELKQYYLRPDDSELINRILLQNLKNKYELIYQKKSDANSLQLEWDQKYLEKKKNRITKKITINESGRFPVEIIGMQAPFNITASPELLQVGYECGFGEKNSMGFGMVE